MSTVDPAHRPCRGPLAVGRRARSDTLGQLVAGLAPAGRQPRRLELRRRQHVGQGRRRPTTPAARSGDVGQGLGLRPGDDGPGALHRLRLDELLPLMERDAMSDEDMVAYLARCQLDPRDAARVDRDAAARVRPGAARAPHAPGRDQRAGRHRRRRAADRTSASATRRPGSRTSARASRCPSRSARRSATTRTSSSSCWPSTA